MDKMKVVVFEIFPKTGKTLQDMLRSIPYVELIESEVNNTEEALALIFTQKPDVVILGNDFPGMDGFYFTKIVHKEAFPTQVILVAEVVSAESVRQAMRAGACDFISHKTLTLEELSKALDLAGQIIDEAKRPESEPQTPVQTILTQPVKTHARLPTRIITVYSPKGGTGVSTIVANLAMSLSRRNNKVLVIDGDMMFGDMAVLLNQRSNYALTDLVKYCSFAKDGE